MRKLRIRLVGGLGNQLFCYFAGLALSSQLERNLELDISDVSHEHSRFDIRSFNLICEVVGKVNQPTSWNLFKRRAINSAKYRSSFILKRLQGFLPLLTDAGFEQNFRFKSFFPKVYAHGYFQDLRYLDALTKNQKESIKLKSPSTDLDTLRAKAGASKSVAVHVRRGDFVAAASYHGCLSAEWYTRVIQQVLNSDEGIKQIWFFSNDIEWCQSKFLNLSKPEQTQLVFLGENELLDPAEVFVLFGEFDFQICANSTFSILAAALGRNESVFLPSELNRTGSFRDLEISLPKNWIQVSPIWE